MRWLLTLVALLVVDVPVLAQLSPEEARQRLEERQKQRQAEREKLVSIKQGELDDMKAELSRLRAENASLRQQLARVPTPAAAPPPAAKKKYTRIEIGMTRQDLLDFVAAHSDMYQLEGVSVHESAHGGAQRTITHEQTIQQGDAPPQTIQRRTEIIDSRTTPRKHELVRINIVEPQQVVTGRHKDSLGHWVPETGIEYRKTGWIWVTVEDDMVTSVDVHAH